MPLKIGVLMGGVSEEKEISLATGKAITNACRANGYEVSNIYFNGQYKNIFNNVQDVDIVFNALHGGSGENGEIQLWLEKNNIKFTGSDQFSSKLCMKKSESKAIANIIGIRTPDWQILKNKRKKIVIELPFVVKPNEQGSTVGLTIVEDNKQIKSAIELAFEHSSEVLLEKYISGREITVSIVGQDIYPILEIIPSHKLYDYECKYTPGMSEYVCPANLEMLTGYNLKKDTKLIFDELGCEGYGRADYIMDERGRYYFLEMNTLPGMTSTSLLPKSATAAGVDFNKLVKVIIEMNI